MKINKSRAIIVFLCIIFLSTVSYPQTIGQVFSKGAADTLFGNVIESVSITQSDLDSVLNQTQNYIMFQIINGELIILGDGRKVLYPAGKNVGPDEVFSLFSKSKVIELLGLGNGTIIAVEKRQCHLTVTFGSNTLELSWPCPPLCQ